MITELIVDRTHWTTGTLAKKDPVGGQCYCILGWVGKASGLSDAEMACFTDLNSAIARIDSRTLDVRARRSSNAAVQQVLDFLVSIDRENLTQHNFIGINDAIGIERPDKEKELIELFRKVGIKLSFVGGAQ